MKCPRCGVQNDADWPIPEGNYNGGGCQDCWEAHCSEEFWKVFAVTPKVEEPSK